MNVSAVSSSYLDELYSASATRAPSQNLANKLFKDLANNQDQAVSMEESGLEQSVFNALDSSGTVSLAELEATLENSAMFSRMQLGLMEAPPEEGVELPDAQQILSDILSGDAGEQVAAVSGEASSSGGGGSASDEEKEYDELDTNQDGVVSLSELETAMKGGAIQGGNMMSMLMGLFSSLANNSYSASYTSGNLASTLDINA